MCSLWNAPEVIRPCRRLVARAEEKRLATAIDATFRRGGCVLIPVFALGKLRKHWPCSGSFGGENSDFPIYIGGLSSKLTAIYDRRSNQSRRQLSRLQLMPEIAPFVLNGQTIGDASARAGRI